MNIFMSLSICICMLICVLTSIALVVIGLSGKRKDMNGAIIGILLMIWAASTGVTFGKVVSILLKIQAYMEAGLL